MTDDIVTRLSTACVGRPYAKIPWPHRLLHDATNEIKGLRSENERLRAVLEMIAGERTCPDYLLGNKDLARIALHGRSS